MITFLPAICRYRGKHIFDDAIVMRRHNDDNNIDNNHEIYQLLIFTIQTPTTLSTTPTYTDINKIAARSTKTFDVSNDNNETTVGNIKHWTLFFLKVYRK